MKKKVPRAPARKVAVKRGQIYRCSRPGLAARHVKVVGVAGANSNQPRASLVEVTRSGRKKGSVQFRSSLRWSENAWRMRPPYELVEGADA